ncbi:hypothetical protein C9374_005365 [Naegleria lovaniensis]|uniref:Uncharacterized protein n=1 Tax=Naegleria lovaniensis TaxID=51637 RepID=A0AA88GPG0_NAELO|nr:uncharacterized protein C9374_005365 [Naegleria lovaniensis]KAG2382163.1 hypothetical protein C9374_005365 [Naegleria lovaniensis]
MPKQHPTGRKFSLPLPSFKSRRGEESDESFMFNSYSSSSSNLQPPHQSNAMFIPIPTKKQNTDSQPSTSPKKNFFSKTPPSSTSPNSLTPNSLTPNSPIPNSNGPLSPRMSTNIDYDDHAVVHVNGKTLPLKKICFLGCCGSGKSTLFRQCEMIFGEACHAKAVASSKLFIQQNLVEVLRVFFEGVLKEQKDKSVAIVDWNVSQKMKTFLKRHSCDKMLGDRIVDPSTWMELLRDEKVRNVLNNLHLYSELNFSISNCIEYYVQEFARLTADSYTPTEEDYVKFVQKTTGVVRKQYKYNDIPFVLLDVGGNRCERKKWPAVLKSCQALCYVISLAEFDESCWEDPKTNRFKESLTTFQELLNGEHIKNKDVFVVFTNVDRFKQKIVQENRLSILRSVMLPASISVDISSDNQVDELIQIIVDRYLEMDLEGQITKHFMINALDRQDAKSQMSEILDSILIKDA